MPTANPPILVIEDDPFLRLIALVLDPSTPAERHAAFADFLAHDEPDFDGYCARVRKSAGTLFPATVRLVATPAQLHASLAGAKGLIVESLNIGADELAAAPELVVVQKYGATLRNIDAPACRARGVKILTIRRRANIACAEVGLALMLMLAKKLNRLAGRISIEELAAEGYPYRPFDRRHTPNSNWARIGGVGMLFGTTLGIIGLGEIGREIALRAAAFGMRILYYQRSPLPQPEERQLQATYVSLEELLATSDWVVPQIPGGAATRHFIDRQRLAQMKAGASIVNLSSADLIDREALIDALQCGRLAGFALDPLYEEPGRGDDQLNGFKNVVLSPHIGGSPRANALEDIAEMVVALARDIGP